MKKCVCTLFLCIICLSSGCGLGGLVSVMGTPGYHEATVPAEYDLTQHKDKMVLVLVEQPGWISANINMRFYLTEAIDRSLAKYVEIPDANLIGYDEIAAFREENSGWSALSAVEIGSRLKAALVLEVHVEDLQLDKAGDADYLKGKLNTRVVLLGVDTGERLWPESEASKRIKVGFEIEDRGWDVAVARLAAASAHCTTRYLYDCRKNRFKIFDDRNTVGWEKWQD